MHPYSPSQASLDLLGDIHDLLSENESVSHHEMFLMLIAMAASYGNLAEVPEERMHKILHSAYERDMHLRRMELQ